MGITAWGLGADGCNCVFLDGIRWYVLVARDMDDKFGFACEEWSFIE
ncbi:MAG: hypothetical protein RMI63_08945 [Caldimicrobium sp.]|nr:hypothetical protein [Caldimicrobium sp.]MDW8095127.1 hypothetical protein [Caldimicrobium sp.]